ncbi:hypothetical protein HYR69_01995 [Candidatus Sumerlaeota bacterium]|nr:hypothetical protein [Candidatus Sumerlaeota bacterium]
MAAGYFKKLLEDHRYHDIDTRSAGVMTVTGLRASQEAMQIMTAEGVDLGRHRSTQLSPDMVRKADLILGMTPLHVQEALRLHKDARGKAFLLKEYSRSDLDKIQIDDPMGATLEVFKKCFREIKEACQLLLKTEFVQGGRKKAKAEAAAQHKTVEVAKKAAAPAKAKGHAKANPAPKKSKKNAPKSERKSAHKPAARKPAAKAKSKSKAKIKARPKLSRTIKKAARGGAARSAVKAR